jgi:hypothetical protein
MGLAKNSRNQNKKTSSCKHGSAYAFFPRYSPQNVVTIQTNILNFGGSYLSRAGAKNSCRPIFNLQTHY